MAKFNCTIITHSGLTIHHAFDEIRDSLAWALSALGHQVSVTENWFSETGETNIIFGTELLADFQRIPKNSVVYNLEQPSHPRMQQVRRLVKESGCAVWDYSSRSVEEWKAAGFLSVYHLPVGYTPNLTRIPHSTSLDWDIFFAGWMTERRTAILDALRKSGLRVFSASAACYGGVRDNLISRSKLCLGVHHDGRDRFEIVRVSYLMANGKCVISEASSDDDEYADLWLGLSIRPYRMLVESCRSLCSSTADDERAQLGHKGLELIRARDFTQAVAAALDSMPIAPTMSRPMEFATTRAATRRDFLSEARNLKPHSTVAARYAAAQRSGDMRDFVVWLREHARGNVMEIGVRDGASTSAFLSGVEEHGGHVYSIDVEPCGNLFAGHPQWTFIQANSTDLQAVIRQIPYQIDLLLIDGDHSRAGVLADFEYARQVRAGGLILFHDILPEVRPSECGDSSWPGDDVKRVYAELCAALAPQGWAHFTVPGRYGLGVLQKPPMTPPAPIAAEPETTEAK